ncbi:MAG: PEP-CTERM sorting domain-containing protein [Planctomycetota bacterium]
MQTQFSLPLLTAALLAHLLVGSASAELSISFSEDGGATFADSFEARLDESMTIGIYLRESAPDTVLSSQGLLSFGVQVNALPGQVGTIIAATPDSRFDLENHNFTSSNGFEWEYADTDPITDLNSTLRLGSFDYQANSLGTSRFSVRDRLIGSGIGNASWLTPSLSVLDEQIFGSNAESSFQFSISTTAIPEPSSSFSCCLAATILLTRRRRKR